jgi:hypothetical protein
MEVGCRASNPIPEKTNFAMKFQSSIAGWIFGKRTMQRKSTKAMEFNIMETRPVGKPRQRWQEDVMEDLKKLKVKNWKEAAKDRRTWRDLAEKAKTPQRVVVPNDDVDEQATCIVYHPSGVAGTHIIANKTLFIHTLTTEFRHTDRTSFEP